MLLSCAIHEPRMGFGYADFSLEEVLSQTFSQYRGVNMHTVRHED